MKYFFLDKVTGAAMKTEGMNKYSIAIMTFMLLTMFFSCSRTKPEFKLDVIDASIFDIGEYRSQKNVTISGCSDAGISITFDLYFTDDDFNLKELKRTMRFLRKSHNNPKGAYSGFIEKPLIQAFGDIKFSGTPMFQSIHLDDIDLKKKVIKGCTLYGAICGEDRFKNKDFKLIFRRKNLFRYRSLDGNYIYRDNLHVPDYIKKITINYDRLTFPNYNSMDDFIASIKNSTTKTTFISPYEDLFKKFTPLNPQKGYFMHFRSYNHGSENRTTTGFERFENDQLYNTRNPHEAHLVIFESYIERQTSNVLFRYGGTNNYFYPSETIVTVTVYDIVSRRIIYSSSHKVENYSVRKQKEIGEEIKELLK